MASDPTELVTIQSLIDNGTIVAHKDGNYGSSYPRTDEFGEEGVPFLTAKLISDAGRINFADAPRLARNRAAQLTYGFIESGDVLLSHNATVGRVALVPQLNERTLIGTSLTYFRVDQTRLLPRYLAAYFAGRDFQNQLKAVMSHSTRNQVPITAQRKLSIVLPSIEEQTSIAQTVGALDDKIEQNSRTARALERLARAIFRAWFLDFEPVKAKAEGATSFPSMPQQIFDALPTRFVDSEIGRVPEGWEVKALDEVAEFLNGLALQKYPPRGDGSDLPVIKIAQLRQGSTEKADKANDSIDASYKVRDGDLLFSWSGTLEAVFWFGGPGALNQHLFKVTSAEYPDWLVYEWIHRHLDEFRLIAASKATTMGHIKRSDLTKALVAIPPTRFLGQSEHVVGPLFGTNAAIQLESRKLAEMRDYLLPLLLSGQVGVESEYG